ncbi:MAG TPA: GNAT family N-acetyltransferase [Terriglobales bacterium]|jgi:CelD/BcsL family acetyltransferase involved in cellulose biosynthesis
MPIQTTVACSEHELAALQPLWDRCFEADPYATVFQSFAWNLAAVRHLSNREFPHVIAVEDDDGHATVLPCGLSPDADSPQALTFLGETLADYRAPITTDAGSRSFAVAWESAASLQLPLQFTALRHDHHSVFDLFSTQDFTGAPYLAEVTAEAFAAEHNRMFSRLRKLQRIGFELHTRTASDPNAERMLRELYANKAAGDKGSLFHDAARVSTLLDALIRLGDCVRITSMERDAETIACAVTIADRGWMRFYTNWYDLEWKHYSPGMVLLFELTRRALADGFACDYLTGDQPYKLRLGNQVAPLRRVAATPAELRHAADQLSSVLPSAA